MGKRGLALSDRTVRLCKRCQQKTPQRQGYCKPCFAIEHPAAAAALLAARRTADKGKGRRRQFCSNGCTRIGGDGESRFVLAYKGNLCRPCLQAKPLEGQCEVCRRSVDPGSELQLRSVGCQNVVASSVCSKACTVCTLCMPLLDVICCSKCRGQISGPFACCACGGSLKGRMLQPEQKQAGSMCGRRVHPSRLCALCEESRVAASPSPRCAICNLSHDAASGEALVTVMEACAAAPAGCARRVRLCHQCRPPAAELLCLSCHREQHPGKNINNPLCYRCKVNKRTSVVGQRRLDFLCKSCHAWRHPEVHKQQQTVDEASPQTVDEASLRPAHLPSREDCSL